MVQKLNAPFKFIGLLLLFVAGVGCGLQQKALDNRAKQDTAVSTGSPNNSNNTPNSSSLDLNSNLILHYKFNTDSATAEDETSQHDGFIQGASSTDGHDGLGVLFDSVLDKITVPANNAFNVNYLTVSTWVYYNGSNGQEQRIFDRASRSDGTQSFYNLRVNTFNKIVIDVTIGGNPVQFHTSTNLNQNAWNHLIYTYDGSHLKFYLNGSLAASLSFQGVFGPYNYNAGIGVGNQLETIKPFNGKLDDFMLYSRALNSSEVSALHDLQK